MVDVGLGYVRIGQPLTTLSGGERQRLKLATRMGADGGGVRARRADHRAASGRPRAACSGCWTGWCDSGRSVIVIEHHQAVMAHADWIIDLGPGAGHDGGRVVFEGTPADLVASRSTLTGEHLAAYVGAVRRPSQLAERDRVPTRRRLAVGREYAMAREGLRGTLRRPLMCGPDSREPPLAKDFEPPVGLGSTKGPEHHTEARSWPNPTSSSSAKRSGEFVPDHSFNRIPVGNATHWRPRRLAWFDLLTARDEGRALASRGDHAREAVTELHPRWRPGESYSGYTRASIRSPTALIPAPTRRLQLAIQAVAGRRRRSGRWVAFAVDGGRIETPLTARNGGTGPRRPRQDVPPGLPDHDLASRDRPAVGLPGRAGHGQRADPSPADDRRAAGPLDDRRRCRLRRLCAVQALLLAGHSFLIRVGRDITLLEGPGYYHEERDGLVCLWPGDHRRCHPPVLRRIELIMGLQAVCLLTDVPGHQGLERPIARRGVSGGGPPPGRRPTRRRTARGRARRPCPMRRLPSPLASPG